MATNEPKKRQLAFKNYEEMMVEVHALIASGYICNGNWTLSQACGHIADWMRFPIDGFPNPPLLMRMIFWVMKHTVGPGMRRKILAEGFRGGMPTAPDTVPKPDAMTDSEAAELLQQTIDRVKAHEGPFFPSPLFGATDRESLEKVSLLHAAHHLGYLEPK
ncbi:MAG: DUF1569 domain-containing protein [Planctomycetales bacterium]|nr:DUF1569 domain-containing protein [Planctomycetales bacterium]